MPKCNFNKVALHLHLHSFSAWVFSCKFAAYFQEHLFQGTPLGDCFWCFKSIFFVLIYNLLERLWGT